MNEYELMYIVPTTFTEEELGTIEKHVTDILSKFEATIKKTVRLGKLRFAYPIKHEQFGHYILVRFQADPSAVASIDEALRMKQKEILRYLIVSGEDVNEESYNLVQFQEVHVESVDRRRRPQQRIERVEDKEKREKEQKEGVAALEEGSSSQKQEEQKKLEKLSAEELQKRIDEALQDKT